MEFEDNLVSLLQVAVGKCFNRERVRLAGQRRPAEGCAHSAAAGQKHTCRGPGLHSGAGGARHPCAMLPTVLGQRRSAVRVRSLKPCLVSGRPRPAALPSRAPFPGTSVVALSWKSAASCCGKEGDVLIRA